MTIKRYLLSSSCLGWWMFDFTPQVDTTTVPSLEAEVDIGSIVGYDFSSFRNHEHLLALEPISADRKAR